MEEIIEYYKTHSFKDTYQKYKEQGITVRKLQSILNENNVEKHKSSFNHKEKKTLEDKVNDFFDKYSKEYFTQVYLSEGPTQTKKVFHIECDVLKAILDKVNIKPMTSFEAKKVCYTNKYGSYEEGVKLQIEKFKSSMNYEESFKKIHNTNIERYGCVSPFGSEQVRDKTKITVQERYGVDNVFQSEDVKRKIRESSEIKYGGIGFESTELMKKTQETLMKNYGVEYACQLPQCIKSTNGSDSKPNKVFEDLLVYNCNFIPSVGDTKEFPLEHYRYDFRIGNTLIEINPTYTHTSSIGYRGGKPIDMYYHMNKSMCAISNNYRCIHIWEWDNVDKIIQLLKEKKKVYARKCIVKEVKKDDAKSFVNKLHLQGWVNSKINLGLYYENELISLMTFGPSRYNKNYEYELLRYCSSMSVVGGAEKIFNHFIKIYNPQSIISYCDLSKFTGNVYTRLGFVKSNRKTKPSKHWYNMKTKKHITDNLLRQQGFDRLFNTSYGKGSSNENLMLQSGFLEVYDCGQQAYTWKSNS